MFVLSEYTPMAPTQVREPFNRDGWVYEEKVDGWRMLAYKGRGGPAGERYGLAGTPLGQAGVALRRSMASGRS